MPHLAKIADDVCFVRAVKTDQFNHAPAQIFLNTGFSQPGRPCLGSWVVYGLGAESQELPAFVVIRQDGSLLGAAEGWDPPAWHAVAEDLSRPPVPVTCSTSAISC